MIIYFNFPRRYLFKNPKKYMFYDKLKNIYPEKNGVGSPWDQLSDLITHHHTFQFFNALNKSFLKNTSHH